MEWSRLLKMGPKGMYNHFASMKSGRRRERELYRKTLLLGKKRKKEEAKT